MWIDWDWCIAALLWASAGLTGPHISGGIVWDWILVPTLAWVFSGYAFYSSGVENVIVQQAKPRSACMGFATTTTITHSRCQAMVPWYHGVLPSAWHITRSTWVVLNVNCARPIWTTKACYNDFVPASNANVSWWFDLFGEVFCASEASHFLGMHVCV